MHSLRTHDFPIAVLAVTLLAAACSARGAFAAGAPGPGSLRLAPAVQDEFPKRWGTSYQGTMISTALGQERKVRVFLPASYQNNSRKYPVIFGGDGEYYFEATVVAARELAAAGFIPECIVVFVETPDRRNDMTPAAMGNQNANGDARAERFLAFLARELRPELEARFRAASPRVLVGHSHGGILCHFAAARWRKDFPFIVSLDAPVHLQERWLERDLSNSLSLGGRLRLVSMEVRFGWRDEDWSQLTRSAPKDWKLTRLKLPDEDHEMMFFDGVYNGLKLVFGDYSAATTNRMRGPDVFAYYESLAKEYGAIPTPPRALLDRAVFELTYTGNGSAARRALAMMASGYGEPEDRARIERDIEKAEQMMKGKESVAELLASPRPTAEEMRPYLGAWKQVKRPGSPGAEAETIVTFIARDGKGAGTMVTNRGDEQFVEECTFLRLTADGIEFGNLNGMHPRGVIARMVHLDGEKLVGHWEFKGVYLDVPGMQPDRSLEFIPVR